MADILLDGLPVLDLLEITPSTSVVARITQRDQSSISRIYRQVSRRLGLEFRKHTDGRYRAGCNQLLLEGLRLSSQWLRLQNTPAEPRWMACGPAALASSAELLNQPPALIQQGDEMERIEALLLERVLDLAVFTWPEGARSASHPALVELPLLRHAGGVDGIVLRRDLQEQPALQALIAAIRHSYQQQLRQHPEQDWLG